MWTSDCLSDSSGTVLCLILNYLSKGKKFPSEKEASPWSYIKLFHSYRLFWLKVLSENWNFLLRKKLQTLVSCLVFLSWKNKSGSLGSLQRWGWMHISSCTPGRAVPLTPLLVVVLIKSCGEHRREVAGVFSNSWMAQS